jgi:hypothetical protein
MNGGRRTVAAVMCAGALMAVGGPAAGAATLDCGNQNAVIRTCASASVGVVYPGLNVKIGLGLNLDADPSTCQPLHVTDRARKPDGSLSTSDFGTHAACGATGPPPTSLLFYVPFGDGSQFGLYSWKLRAAGPPDGPPQYLAPSSGTVKAKLVHPPMPGRRCDTAENLDLCASGWVINPDNTSHLLPAQVGENMAVAVRVTDLGCSCSTVSLKVAVKRPDSTQFVPYSSINHPTNGVVEWVVTFPADQAGTYIARVNLSPNLGDFNLGPKVILHMDVTP